jgi:hypothetical protein
MRAGGLTRVNQTPGETVKHSSSKRPSRVQFAIAIAGCAVIGSALGVGLTYGLMALGVYL